MSPNILSEIKRILIDKKLLDSSKLDTLESTLKFYKRGDLIYPGVLIRKLNITMKQAYKILEAIKELGVIIVNYELYCFSCSKFAGYIYETISQMPEQVECEECGEDLIPLEDNIVVYKVKVDE